MLTALLLAFAPLVADPQVNGHALDVTLVPTVEGQEVVGTRMVIPFHKFTDDPENRIIYIEYVGGVFPLHTYGAENLLTHSIDRNDYSVSVSTWFRIKVMGSGHPNALRRSFVPHPGIPWQPSWGYGNQDRDLTAFDGAIDFQGLDVNGDGIPDTAGSGFTVQYGGAWEFPVVTSSGTYHLTIADIQMQDFIRQPGDPEGQSWSIVELDAPQFWQWQYQPAWPSWHGFAFFADPGTFRLDGHFVAVHADGTVQQ